MPPPPSFAERLAAATRDAGSALCIGLDPDPRRLPSGVSRDASGAVAFCVAITDSTQHVAAAFKPNLAFFEALGPDGAAALADVCAHVRASGRLLVLDGKRGDIGNTGRLYAEALFGRLGGDAATVAPYMGTDSVSPFLATAGRCAFVLVATSNPGAAGVQGLPVSGEPLYRHVARMAVAVADGAEGEVGFVVGATRPEVLAALRAEHPTVPFLVPGVGAQGGSPAETMAANAGGPVLVNVGRDVLYASSGSDYASAAARAAGDVARRLR
ncbi:MAG TPA: orotidine-5'-phosphate decarboxylase [Rubricoccaceae bacterium]|jgi:orotidine-5'-phosphate decarboxylase